MNVADCIVAGGGFPGIYAAWRLAKSGHSVCLVEASNSLGGVMKSRHWNGYWLDNGTQNLDLRSDLAYQFYSEILGNEMRLLKNHDWASTIDKTHTAGFEMPDFSIDDSTTARRAISELKKLENRGAIGQTDTNLPFMQWYEKTYGPSLTTAIRPMLAKITGGHTDAIGMLGRTSLSMLLRPKLADDEIMVRLKGSSDFFNDRVGVTRHCGDNRFTGNLFSETFAYPSNKGLGEFCKLAEKRLKDLGVNIQYCSVIDRIESHTSEIAVQSGYQSIAGNKLLWTLPDHLLSDILEITDSSVQESLPVGYCIYAFEVKNNTILGPDYLHDFSEDRLPFRYSRPGVYSAQSPRKNYTLVMAEVPSHPNDQNALMEPSTIKRVWLDCIDSGYIQPDTTYINSCCWSIPVAFTLPTCAWYDAYQQARQHREVAHPRIVGIEPNSRGRAAFISHFDTQLGSLLP